MKSRVRRYRVTADGPEGHYYGGIHAANTKRAAIRRAVVRFHLETMRLGLNRRASDYAWSAEYAPLEATP